MITFAVLKNQLYSVLSAGQKAHIENYQLFTQCHIRSYTNMDIS